jgi:hypothetical protein
MPLAHRFGSFRASFVHFEGYFDFCLPSSVMYFSDYWNGTLGYLDLYGIIACFVFSVWIWEIMWEIFD